MNATIVQATNSGSGFSGLVRITGYSGRVMTMIPTSGGSSSRHKVTRGQIVEADDARTHPWPPKIQRGKYGLWTYQSFGSPVRGTLVLSYRCSLLLATIKRFLRQAYDVSVFLFSDNVRFLNSFHCQDLRPYPRLLNSTFYLYLFIFIQTLFHHTYRKYLLVKSKMVCGNMPVG